MQSDYKIAHANFYFANILNLQENFISLTLIRECRLFQACVFYQVGTLNLVKNLQIPGKKKKKGTIGIDS